MKKFYFILLVLTLFFSCESPIVPLFTLPNGNKVIMQYSRQQKENLYSMITPTGEVIISPGRFKILSEIERTTFILAATSWDKYYILNENGEYLFRDSYLNITYSIEHGKFILVKNIFEKDYFSESVTYKKKYYIADTSGVILYETFSELSFAKGLDNAYIETQRNGKSIVNSNGKLYTTSEYTIIGCYAVLNNDDKQRFINLNTGEKKHWNKILFNKYIEYEDGILNAELDEMLLEYDDSIYSKSNVLKKRLVYSDKNYNSPFSLKTIVDGVPYFTANLDGHSTSILYKVGTNGNLRVSPYNCKTIEEVKEYLADAHLYNDNAAVSFDFDNRIITIESVDWGIQYCKVNDNGEWAYFQLYDMEMLKSLQVILTAGARFYFNQEYFTINIHGETFIYDNIRKEKEYKPWWSKQWTDGHIRLAFDRTNAYVMDNEDYLGTAKYTYVYPNLSFALNGVEASESEYSIMFVSPDKIGWEGGAPLTEIDFTDYNTNKNKNHSIEEYKWLKGTWEAKNEDTWGIVEISDSTYKSVSSNWNQNPSEIDTVTERPISIEKIYNYITSSEILAIDSTNVCIGIDEGKKQVFLILGEYTKLCLDKVK